MRLLLFVWWPLMTAAILLQLCVLALVVSSPAHGAGYLDSKLSRFHKGTASAAAAGVASAALPDGEIPLSADDVARCVAATRHRLIALGPTPEEDTCSGSGSTSSSSSTD